METFDYDNGIVPEQDTIVSGSAMPDSMVPDTIPPGTMMPDNMMFDDVTPDNMTYPNMTPDDTITYDMPANTMFGDIIPDNMAYGSMMPDEYGRGFRPGGQGSNSCRNCSYYRPNNNLMYWTWQLFGPNVNRPQSARVRFFNATSIREPLDIYLNNRLVLSNLGRSEASGFLNIVPGTYRLTVFRRGPLGRPVVNTNVAFSRNSSQLLTLLGSLNNARVQVTRR